LSRHFIALREETQKYNRRRGLYSFVARELGLTAAHVRNVALGLRRSQRVEEALESAFEKFNGSREKAA
jgi:hypothetical protein